MEFKHINLAFLKDFTNGNPATMAKYIDMFLKLSGPALESMKTAAGAEDWESLRSTAHGLKPQIGYMGIDGLKEVVLKIENNARDRSHLDQIPALLTEFEKTYTEACKELEEAKQLVA